ncbi:MAG: LamG domain-containing protein [Candidatus Pacearchaeota archaeon]|jgi:hypothetical protein
MIKRGQTGVISIILIVLIVLILFIIVWNLFYNIVKKSADKTNTYPFTTFLEVDSIGLHFNGEAEVLLHTISGGETDVSKLKFQMHYTDGTSNTMILENGNKQMETKIFSITPNFIETSKKLSKVSVYPIFEDGVVGMESNRKIPRDGLLNPDDLVFWHRMEQINLPSTLIDTTGNFPGQIFEANQVPGKNNNGMSFDGVNDYVRLADSNQIIQYNNNFSIFAFFKANQIPSDGPIPTNNRIITFHRPSLPSVAGTAISFLFGDTDKAIIRYYDGACQPKYFSASNIEANKWYFIGLTYDGENYRSYLDLAKVVREDTFCGVGDFDAFIGAYSVNSAVINGIIDEVMVFNRSLNDNEVIAIYNNLK